MVPEYCSYIVLMFLTALFFGINVLSDKPTAKYCDFTLIALLILVNGSIVEGADFSEKFIVHVILIALAVLYIVTALKVLDRYWPARKTDQARNP